MHFSYPCDAVRCFVRCSVVFSRMKYPHRFGCREKQSVCISVNSKFLLNHKELERVFYMKKLCLVNLVNIFLNEKMIYIKLLAWLSLLNKHNQRNVMRC